ALPPIGWCQRVELSNYSDDINPVRAAWTLNYF
ncbi:MAG: hypothetical protein ACI8ZV_002319, partial [Chitinophagales bacterium]